MATKVIMPKHSPTMEEGQISRWLKKEGDKVSMGEPLAEIDTDKATMEMQALTNGVLRKILIQEGESAPLGQMIAIVGEPDEDISSLLNEAPAKETPKAAAEAAPAPQPAAAEPKPAAEPKAEKPEPPKSEAPAAENGSGAGRLIVSPLAARMAAEAGVDFSGVLCGRATWKDAIPIYARGGVHAVEDWLKHDGVENILAVNRSIETATPWFEKFGVTV